MQLLDTSFRMMIIRSQEYLSDLLFNSDIENHNGEHDSIWKISVV